MSGHAVCGLTGCNKKHYAQGLCGPHYKRLWAFGTTEDPPKKDETK